MRGCGGTGLFYCQKGEESPGTSTGTDGNGLRGVVHGTHRWELLKSGMWVQRLPFLRTGGWSVAMERYGVKGNFL
ncbi:hypothetical protein [Gabonibacter massiliensis]|uniref:hypothetical protein n=1 Tax=Gabonibacter massiliensis TaxID=1720195 RepID=UPI0011C7D071|nr:hypothetical protein [Gabonibacter massiliensis]